MATLNQICTEQSCYFPLLKLVTVCKVGHYNEGHGKLQVFSMGIDGFNLFLWPRLDHNE